MYYTSDNREHISLNSQLERNSWGSHKKMRETTMEICHGRQLGSKGTTIHFRLPTRGNLGSPVKKHAHGSTGSNYLTPSFVPGVPSAAIYIRSRIGPTAFA
jgi:hypothetical protein